MAYSQTELKAIAWWSENNNLIPQLSVRPMVRFMNKITKDISEQNIIQLEANFKSARAEQNKERARAAKAKKAKDSQR